MIKKKSKKQVKESYRATKQRWLEKNKEKLRAYHKIYQRAYKAKKKLEQGKIEKPRIKEIKENNFDDGEMFIIENIYHKKSKIEIYNTKKVEEKIGKCLWVIISTDNLIKTITTFNQNKNLKIISQGKSKQSKDE